jgi:hypothetical protein
MVWFLANRSIAAEQITTTSSTSHAISEWVSLIQSTQGSSKKIKDVTELSSFFSQLDVAAINSIDSDAIDKIAALLEDDNDDIRRCAAQMLGRIGPHAKRAVPALEKALKPLIGTGVIIPATGNLASDIIVTISNITDQPPSDMKLPRK